MNKKITIIIFLILVIGFAVTVIFEAESEIYLIDPDFNGQAMVVFDQIDGQAPEYDKENNRIYRIPKDGILRTQFSYNSGIRLHKGGSYESYFLVYFDSIYDNSFGHSDAKRIKYKGINITCVNIGTEDKDFLEEKLLREIK